MPIPFTCPHCGATTQVADQYAGQSGPCAQCGKTITVPGSPAMGHPSAGAARSTNWWLIGAAAAVGVVGICVVGVLLALLLPAVQSAREAGRRVQCSNNMKRIALALLNYEAANGSFPPAYIPDANGRPMHSWRVLILPYLEEPALYNQYDFNEPWNGPNNARLASAIGPVYSCPSDDGPSTETDYLMVVGQNTLSDGPTARKITDIADGTSHTLLFVECNHSGIHWMDPRDLPADLSSFTVNDPNTLAPRGNHPGGCHAATCDGAVLFLDETTDPSMILGAATIDGGEAVDLRDY